MTNDLAVLVPVLNRPHRVKPTIDAWKRSTPPIYDLYFIADPDDEREIKAIRKQGAKLMLHAGSWGQKINFGVHNTTHPLIYMSADDIEPEPGWLAAAQPYLETHQVIGINDQLPRTRVEHATHFVVTRAAAELPTLDKQPGPIHEGYTSWFADDEYILSSQKRGIYTYAKDVKATHLHPQAGSAPDDATYQRGRDHARMDQHIFWRRSGLWA